MRGLGPSGPGKTIRRACRACVCIRPSRVTTGHDRSAPALEGPRQLPVEHSIASFMGQHPRARLQKRAQVARPRGSWVMAVMGMMVLQRMTRTVAEFVSARTQTKSRTTHRRRVESEETAPRFCKICFVADRPFAGLGCPLEGRCTD